MIRAFLGVAVPDDICRRLTSVQGGLPGARWVADRNLHLTLVFLGEVEEGLLEELAQSLEGLCAMPIELDIEGLGIFGGSKPRTLWAGVKTNPALEGLQAKLVGLASRLGIEVERRKFTPHITLARLDHPPSDRLAALVVDNAPFHVGRFTVDHVTLFESRLGREGSEYTGLAEFALTLGA